jgi:cyclophilin family peptidyl-prolyl cis-trans isomerase
MRYIHLTALVATLVLCSACATVRQEPAAAPEPPEPEEVQNTMLTIKTSLGAMEVEMFDDQAPITVENFLRYVDEGHYNGTIFHRVIKGFMIQGGGFEASMHKKPTHEPIKNESDNGLKNMGGTLAMARLPDPDSATAQFFINTVDNPNLDHRPGKHGYAVFGKVTSGLEVLQAIEGVSTRQMGPHANVPAEPVVIESISRK